MPEKTKIMNPCRYTKRRHTKQLYNANVLTDVASNGMEIRKKVEEEWM